MKPKFNDESERFYIDKGKSYLERKEYAQIAEENIKMAFTVLTGAQQSGILIYAEEKFISMFVNAGIVVNVMASLM